MKRNFKLSILPIVMGFFLTLSGVASAQTFQLVRGGYDGATFTVTTPNLQSSTQTVDNEKYTVLSFAGATHLFREGEPDLPILSQVIELPLCSDVQVTVSNVQTRSMNLESPVWNISSTRLLPMQPAPSKSDLGPRPFVIDTALYATDAFYSAPQTAWVDRIGVARDRNLGVLRISPVSYNPVTGQVELITSMTVTLTYKHADEAATRELHRRYYSPAFSLGGDVMATLPADKSVRNAAPLHYLIVAHSSFRGALDGFVAWKQRRGMIVTIAYTDDPGVGTTSTAIAQYVKGFYTNATDELPAPTYLLLVGDNEQIPAFNARCSSPASDHITDLYYVTWDGDNLPDCYRGRFSAQTLAQLTPQIEKTLLYEGYNFTDPSYLGRGVLIAGEDGGYQGDNAYTYADPSMDYVAKTYVNAANGYTDIYYYKNNTSFAPAGVTVTGSSQTSATATALRNLYNQGCGWVNYTAHGSENSWATPLFNTSQVSQMTNNGKPGIFIGNCCITGRFENSTCFGESLLRKDNNAGGVAYIGATNSTYWPHDFCWSVGFRNNISGNMNTSYDASNLGMYDRLFHTHNEDHTVWHNTMGSMVTAGNMAVETYGSYQLYYWEIYQLFGDPSLIPWLALPADMPCNVSGVITMGTGELTFQTAPRAYVALTNPDDHTLIAATFADPSTGDVSLQLPASMLPGTYELAIWAQGYKPHFQEVTVIVPEGPYLSILAIQPQEKVTPGHANIYDLVFTNVGIAPCQSATFTLEPLTEGAASLLPAYVLTEAVLAGDTFGLHAVGSIYVPATCVDGSMLKVKATVDFDTFSISRVFSIPVVAPVLTTSNVAASSAVSAAMPVTITCTLSNVGHDSTADLTLSLLDNYALMATPPAPVHVGVLAPDQSYDLSFTATMVDNLPQTSIPFLLVASANGSTTVVDEFTFLGDGVATEDFESGDFLSYNWNLGNSNRWEITNADKHAGTYSARSKTNLSNRTSSTLSIVWTSVVDDSISFWYKTSTEEGYDVFNFAIDQTPVIEASGVMSGWERASAFVPAGTHTFTFIYHKDMSATAGSDCVWIDDITFPYAGDPCTFVNDSVCQYAEYPYRDTLLPTDELGTTVYVDTNATDNSIVWFALTVVESPVVTITSPGTIYQGGQAVLTAHGATTYLWSTGDTTASIIVTPNETTSYSVTGYRGGCSGEATVTVAVGIDDPASTIDRQLSVYPNPTSGNLSVSSPLAIQRLTLLDIKGQVLYQRDLNASAGSVRSARLSLDSYPQGVYFLRIDTGNSTVVRKVVKK